MVTVDLSGMQFGNLSVLNWEGGEWNCLCSCGNSVRVTSNPLTRGATKSCGCKRSGTLETFVESARLIHGDKYDYSKVIFTTLNTKVEITCNKHGTSFMQKPCKHLTGQGCTKCGHDLMKQKQSCTASAEFSSKASLVHGVKYDYTLVKYKNAMTRVEIGCNTCGSKFLQSPNAHLAGKGCVKCAEYGFNVNANGNLYVMTCGDITKVGITNKAASIRAKTISKSYGSKFSVVVEINLQGQLCSDVETSVLRKLRQEYRQPISKFDGHSECFLEVNSTKLLNLIAETIEALK